MVSIVLASHGDLAAGIKQTGSMVFGDQPSVAVVSLEPSMGPDDFRAKVEEAIASFEDQEQVLFLVDLWGGTPFNQISRAHRGPRFLGYRHRCQPAYAHRGIFAAL